MTKIFSEILFGIALLSVYGVTHSCTADMKDAAHSAYKVGLPSYTQYTDALFNGVKKQLPFPVAA